MCFNCSVIEFYLLIGPFIFGAAFKYVGLCDQVSISSSGDTQLACIPICLFCLLPGTASLVQMFTWVHIKNWATILESFLKSKNLKGLAGGIVTKAAFTSLNTKHINTCSVKTKVIVTPGLPDLWERLAKKAERSTK